MNEPPKCYQHRDDLMFHTSTVLRHFEHTIDQVPYCIKQALNTSKHLVQSSPYPLLLILTVLWVCRFRRETDHHDKFMNNQTSPPCCSSHICSSDHFDTVGAD